MPKKFVVETAGYIDNFRNAITSDDPLLLHIAGADMASMTVLLGISEMKKVDVGVPQFEIKGVLLALTKGLASSAVRIPVTGFLNYTDRTKPGVGTLKERA